MTKNEIMMVAIAAPAVLFMLLGQLDEEWQSIGAALSAYSEHICHREDRACHVVGTWKR